MTSFFNLLLTQGAPPQPQGGLFGNSWFPFAVIGLMLFVVLRGGSKQRKEQEARIAALQKGDRVITNSGIHALVHNIGEKTVTLKVAEGVMMEFDKAAVAVVTKKETSSESK